MYEKYNDLPLADNAKADVAQLEQTVLPQLAALLVQHGLQFDFNIWLAHRHIQLGDVEQVVELKGRDISVSSVFRDGEPESAILESYDLQIPSNLTIVPDTFLVDDGNLIPMEYVCVEPEEAQDYIVAATKASREFSQIWAEILDAHNVVGKLGLTAKATDSWFTTQGPLTLTFDDKLGVDVKSAPPPAESAAPRIMSSAWEVHSSSGGIICRASGDGRFVDDATENSPKTDESAVITVKARCS
jgi:hypothetical protein